MYVDPGTCVKSLQLHYLMLYWVPLIRHRCKVLHFYLQINVLLSAYIVKCVLWKHNLESCTCSMLTSCGSINTIHCDILKSPLSLFALPKYVKYSPGRLPINWLNGITGISIVFWYACILFKCNVIPSMPKWCCSFGVIC